MTGADVISGAATHSVEQGDAVAWLNSLPADSVDLVMGSPPYEAQRTYGVGFDLKGQAWVDWMVEVFRASLRVCRGLVVMVVEGFTKNYRWSATPALLMADLHRAGVCLRKPPIYERDGIPGSGGPDWWKNRYEFCVCATRGGRLPWSDNTATGSPPKFGPGGEISHRTKNGSRVNDPRWGGATRKANGEMAVGSKDGGRKRLQRGSPKGSPAYVLDPEGYKPPKIANPGNIIDCGACGGGHLGDADAHDSEAPYPEKLVEPFVRCFCPPGGIVADPFSGSGTTGKVALVWGRRFVGCDLRQSQVDLSLRRLVKALEPKPQEKPRREKKPPPAGPKQMSLFGDADG